MVKVGLVGAGKMGISHLSILGAHKDVKVVGVCDSSKMIMDVLKKYTQFQLYRNFQDLITQADADAIFVAVPTKYHADMVKKIMEENIHVFVEKPLCLKAGEGKQLIELANKKKIIGQVGYHNKFIGTFHELKRIVERGFLGKIFHFVGESYGPVVTQKKQSNWRSNPDEGGGCLMDYASHVIDLVNYILGPIKKVNGSMLKSFYSKKVEDAVFSLLELDHNISGILSVNWSDETYRKMSTSITIQGENGKVICDANELKVYFKTDNCPNEYTKGWNIRNVTELTKSVEFYLRGEEYSAQIDHFINAVQRKVDNSINNFESAWHTDKVIAMIRQSANN